jgi:hypothetical protein
LKKNRRYRWILGGVALLLAWMLPHGAFCQEASIREVTVKGTNRAWRVGFYVENCFTGKMEEAIQSGVRTSFTFYLRLYETRNWWRDRKVNSLQFHHTILYDPIGGEYQVVLEEKGTSLTTRNLGEAKRWMARVDGVEIRPATQVKPGFSGELYIKAELDPVRLPLHLEYLFFFVSLWNFETSWHVEPLPP